MNLENGLLFWIFTGAVATLVGVAGFFIRRWINSLSQWKEGLDEKGGVVTRDQYFAWCKDSMERCAAVESTNELVKWKNDILEKGGALTLMDGTKMVEKISKETSTKLDETITKAFDSHAQLMNSKLELIHVTLEKRILEELVKLGVEIRKNGSTRRQ